MSTGRYRDQIRGTLGKALAKVFEKMSPDDSRRAFLRSLKPKKGVEKYIPGPELINHIQEQKKADKK